MCLDYALTDASSVLWVLWPAGRMSERLGPVHWAGWLSGWFDEPESLILAQSERWRHA